ncbi:MAG TPA: hypothetical protein VI727_05110 [Candidatus Brocadiaceae bacterium]|nr:hypothetical protein [Candidatus Brocadiaceae bacterium]
MNTRFTKAVFIIIMATVVLILSDMARTKSNAYSLKQNRNGVRRKLLSPQ